MIASKKLSAAKMANAADCSKRSIKRIRSNIRCFGTTRAPSNGAGRRRSITPFMLQALKQHLLEKPGLYLDEMVLFLWDEFQAVVTAMSISRALKSISWSKSCEICIFITCQISFLISWCTWMSRDATKGSASGEQVGPRSASPLLKSHSTVVSVDIRSYLRMPRMALSLRESSRDPLTAAYSRISSSSFSHIVGDGQNRSPY